MKRILLLGWVALWASSPAAATVIVRLAPPAALTPGLRAHAERADGLIRSLLGPDCSLQLRVPSVQGAGAAWSYHSSGWSPAHSATQRAHELQALRAGWPGALEVLEEPGPRGSPPTALPPRADAPNSPAHLALLARPLTYASLGGVFDGSPASSKDVALEQPISAPGLAAATPDKTRWLRRGLASSLLAYSVAVGAREGYTWADAERRRDNLLIQGRLGDGQGALDYHSWRSVEQLSVLGAIVSAYALSRKDGDWQPFARILVGSALLGYFVYERALNYVVTGDLFPKKGRYHQLGLSIPRSQAFDVAAGLAGVWVLADFDPRRPLRWTFR